MADCPHVRLTRILGGPDYACNECGALFRATNYHGKKELHRK